MPFGPEKEAQAAMPAHVEETIRLIALLHARHRQDGSSAQRTVDRATALVGQPAFPALVCCIVALWLAANLATPFLGFAAIDPPPFSWLALLLSATALVMTGLILVTQRGSDKLADVRSQMNLELTLLTEQKVTKIIELVEELRRDSPEVRDRIDSEAHEMSTRSDPHAVLQAIGEIDKEMCGSTDD